MRYAEYALLSAVRFGLAYISIGLFLLLTAFPGHAQVLEPNPSPVQVRAINADLFDDIQTALAELKTATQAQVPKNRVKSLVKKLDNAKKAVDKAKKQLAKDKEKQAKKQLRKARHKLRQYQDKLKQLKRKGRISKSTAKALRAQAKDIILLIKAAISGGPIGNTTPVANAGLDQTLAVGETAQLDGSGSSDADGDPLSYQWTLVSRPAGSQAALSDDTLVKPTLLIDRPGEYMIELIVDDGIDLSVPDTIVLSTQNTAPIAEAGPDQTLAVGATAQLDGSGSSDANGDPLSYQWTLSRKPATSRAVLSGATTVNPSFVIDAPGTYEIDLIVNDGNEDSAPDRVIIVTENTAPVADAGSDQSAAVGATVNLDGSSSSDVDGDALSYTWALVSTPEDSEAELSDPNAVMPSFIADLPGTYIAQLIVNDGSTDSPADTVTITTENTAPVAEAGPDQTVAANTIITLDGSGSTDIDGDLLSYAWSLSNIPAGSSASLDDPTAVMPSFLTDLPGPYVAQLIVNDGTADSTPDSLTITAENIAPIAEAGPDQSVNLGATAFLDGSGSSDANNDPLSYAWSLLNAPAGSHANLLDPTTVSPSFGVDEPGLYVIQLIVNDGRADSAPDEVRVSTLNTRPVAEAGPDQTVFIDELVQLDGSGSNDVDGDALNYQWAFLSVPTGSNASLTGATSVNPSFDVDTQGVYVIQLIVNDSELDSIPDTVTITAQNRMPVADAGPDQSADVGATVNLDGSGSSDPDGDALSYFWTLTGPSSSNAVLSNPQAVQPSFVPDQAGTYQAELVVNDGSQDSVPDTTTININGSANQAPEITSTPLLTASVGQLYRYDVAASDPDGDSLVFSLTQAPAGMNIDPDTGLIEWTPSTAGNASVTVQVKDPSGLAASQNFDIAVSDSDPLPPDPETIAPDPEPGETTTIDSSTQFLYEGSDPIQTGVSPGTIEPKRAAVIRGRVLDKNNAPLPGVKITILNHPEFGQTLSRADGMFDMAVNGGGLLTVNYQKAGLLPSQRQVNVPWQDFALVDDVVMIAQDSQTSVVDLNNPSMQVAQGSVETDQDGSRQATLLFPAGISANMVMPDGSTQPLSNLTVRATEYTVDGNGPEAMPGDLPASSGYTYAVELSADEAQAAGATRVEFSQPIPNYVENFLNFPIGGEVPTAYYDRERGLWVPHTNGRVVEILSISAGRANLDVTGNGTAASASELAELSITDAEREQLASLYNAGDSLWRVLIPHFTPWGHNWPFGPPDDATGPTGGEPTSGDGEETNDEQCFSCPCPPATAGGSIIETENQILGERIPIVGTGLALNYRSDRVPGRKVNNIINIPLSGDTIPASLKRIDLAINYAGRRFTDSFTAVPNRSTTFNWDGKNAYAQTVQGAVTVKVEVSFVYDGVYQQPRSGQSFGAPSGVEITGSRAREEVMLSKSFEVALEQINAREIGLGGWTLTPQHFYDVNQSMLWQGNGGRRNSNSISAVITTIAGIGTVGSSGDGGPATEAELSSPKGIAIAGDGSILIADTFNDRIRRIDPNGIITTIAGIGTVGSSGDGGPATEAELYSPEDIAIARDGSILIADTQNQLIRRIDPNGIITTIAGTGGAEFSGDGGPATEVSLFNPTGIAIAEDGSVLIADTNNDRIRRIDPNGIITTIAGTGIYPFSSGFSGDGGPATEAKLFLPEGIAIARDGGILIADTNNDRIRRIDPNGIITTIAGTDGPRGFSGDGGPATEAGLNVLAGIAIAADGSILIADTNNNRIRRIDPNGIIITIAGTGEFEFGGDGGPATEAKLSRPKGIAIAGDGSILIADTFNNRIRRINPTFPSFDDFNIVITSLDGTELYEFSPTGRHLRTVDAQTGTTLTQFAYTNGRLSSITDADDNVITIEYDSNGQPKTIIAPFGQRTELTVDANGWLASVTNPNNETVSLGYTADGLLTSMITARNHSYTYRYDALGRLLEDRDPAGGVQTLSRSELENGYETFLENLEGYVRSYKVERLPIGDRIRTLTASDGTETTVRSQSNGRQLTTYPNGSEVDTLLGPDPRFSMQSPLPSSQTITTPSGLVTASTVERNATLDNEADPLSLTEETTTTTVNNKTATTVYDAATRTYTTTTPAGRSSETVVDAQSRVLEERVPGIEPVRYSYDARGRLKTIRQGNGSEERLLDFSYNAEGYLGTLTDPLGRSTSFVYDDAGRVLTQTLPGHRSVGFDYDANGNLTGVVPPGQPRHGFNFSPVDQVLDYTPPDVSIGNTATDYDYNSARQLTQVSRPDNKIISYGYDAASRLDILDSPRGQYDYDYDPNSGQLSSILAPANERLSYSYDGDLLTTVNWDSALSPVNDSVSYSYDNDRRLATITAGGETINFDYDDDDLLTQAGAANLSYDAANGLMLGLTLDNINGSYSHNSFAEVREYTANINTTALYQVQYQRDKLGRITQKTETVNGASMTLDYVYDAAGRLEQVATNGTVSATYSYDANGNRLSKTGPGYNETGSYDAQDRLLSYAGATYAYTANGELQRKTEGSQITAYDYDVFGNLIAVSLPNGDQIEYLIDGQNRRIGKKVNGSLVQGLLYQDQLNPVVELNPDGTTKSVFVYGSRVNVPEYVLKPDGTRYRVITDQLGSPRLVVDTTTGAIMQRLDYDEFGQVTLDTNPGFQPFGFAGGIYDRDTGLVRFGARDYDAVSGRWTNQDPIRFDGGLNLYAYCNNDPINCIDPRGLIVDTIADIGFILYDLYALADDAINNNACNLGTNLGALGANIVGALIPGATGLGASVRVSKSGLGDLTKAEVKQIQSVVDEAGRPLDVIGSAAKGSRRNPGSNLPFGKGDGTKSDIDFITNPQHLPHFSGKQELVGRVSIA